MDLVVKKRLESGQTAIIIDKDYLYNAYIVSLISMPDIAKEINVSTSVVRTNLVRYNIDRRNTKESIDLVRYKLGKHMLGKKRHFSDKTKENMKLAAIKRGEKYAKGITLKPSGYYEITRGVNKYRRLHVVLMEEFLNRKLLPNEVVHHVNGIKTDNRIENLQVMTVEEHCKFHALKNIRDGVNYDISKESKKGEDHFNAKLKEKQVIDILLSDKSALEISKIYNVGIECIKSIKYRRTWKHLNINNYGK